jgi:hypothetical protein
MPWVGPSPTGDLRLEAHTLIPLSRKVPVIGVDGGSIPSESEIVTSVHIQVNVLFDET